MNTVQHSFTCTSVDQCLRLSKSLINMKILSLCGKIIDVTCFFVMVIVWSQFNVSTSVSDRCLFQVKRRNIMEISIK